jgi:hypothetical protein
VPLTATEADKGLRNWTILFAQFLAGAFGSCSFRVGTRSYSSVIQNHDHIFGANRVPLGSNFQHRQRLEVHPLFQIIGV